MRRLLACVVLAVVLTGCGGGGLSDSRSTSFSEPRDLAKKLGCESSYEDRNGDIGYPQFVEKYGACKLNGHNAFLSIYREAGGPAKLRAENPAPLPELDHWVSGSKWAVEVPEARPGEIDKLKELLGDSGADARP